MAPQMTGEASVAMAEAEGLRQQLTDLRAGLAAAQAEAAAARADAVAAQKVCQQYICIRADHPLYLA
jgi:hypothetical protein